MDKQSEVQQTRLTDAERAEYHVEVEHTESEIEHLESKIEAEKPVKGDFKRLGIVLGRIRDERLYRQDFRTFEDYCRRRWGRSAKWAYQLIKAAKVAKNIEQISFGYHPREFVKDVEQVVYFILNRRAGAIKIGTSSDPIGRMVSLQIGTPDLLEMVCTIPGGKLKEKELHGLFEEDRISGEWFKLSEMLLRYIEGLPVF
jgi:hypothetical protein